MLLTALLFGLLQEPAKIENREQGFSIAAPVAGWTLAESAADGLLWRVIAQPAAAALAEVGGPGMVQLRVEIARATTTALATRDEIFEQLGSVSAASNGRKCDFALGEESLPGFTVDYQEGQLSLVLRQYYFVAHDRLFRFQLHAPAENWESFGPMLEQTMATFSLIDLAPEAAAAETLHALARRCGSEIAWSPDWEAAAQRARTEKKLVLVAMQSYGGFELGDLLATGPFMDPDVVGLVQTRFVALRYHKGMPAPFVAPEKYGLSGSAFGLALMLVTPDGDVVRETFTSDGILLARFLREGLRGHARLGGPPPPPDGTDQFGKIAWLQRCGELEASAQLIETARVRGAEQLPLHLARAEQHRLLLQGEAALVSLLAATTLAKGDADQLAAIELRRIVVHAGLGDLVEAAAAAARANRHAAPTNETMWWLGLIALAKDDLPGAKQQWMDLIAHAPEDRWSWWAAGMLTHPLFEQMDGASLAWPSDADYALVAETEPGPLPVARAAEAHADARAWLLAEQRDDGSWPTPSEVGQTQELRHRNRFLHANAALGGWALLESHPDAAERALDYLLSALERERARDTSGDDPQFMDYTVWSASYALHFLAEALDAELGDAARVRAALDQCVATLAGLQKANGGWSYYLSPTLAGAKQPSGQAISFTTATVVLGLQHAEESGISLPEGLLAAGLDALEAMRDPTGVFAYFLEPDGSRTPRTGIPGAAGRGPVCCMPLLYADRESLDDLRARLTIFTDHLPELAREQGKVMMHAGADTQGSHYLLYDYAMAATAMRSLPKGERKLQAETVLRALLAARCEDGSYVDNPQIGRHASTALALLAFDALGVPAD